MDKLDKFSPLERERLEKEIDDLKLQNEKMKCVIVKIIAVAEKETKS